MLIEFINYLYKQQHKVDSIYKFYISKVEDDRVEIDVYRYYGSSNTVGNTFEYYSKLTVTDDTIEKFINGYYDILFEEWFIKHHR